MHWKLKLLILLMVGIPAFTGYPLSRFDAEIIKGVGYALVFYWIITSICLMWLVGPRRLAIIISIAAPITFIVVFCGGSISYLLYLANNSLPNSQTLYSAHYAKLSVTMLTVIPLALSMVTIIPFHSFEPRLLSSKAGISRTEKALLMALRVFNHIVFYVIPNVLEVTREEHAYTQWKGTKNISNDLALTARVGHTMHASGALVKYMTHICLESICEALQYIPLWAMEIARLPTRKTDE